MQGQLHSVSTSVYMMRFELMSRIRERDAWHRVNWPLHVFSFSGRAIAALCSLSAGPTVSMTLRSINIGQGKYAYLAFPRMCIIISVADV